MKQIPESELQDSKHDIKYKPTAMRIKLLHSSKSVSCLLDTGAGISLIDESFVSSLTKSSANVVNLKGLGTSRTTGSLKVEFSVTARHEQEWVDLQFAHVFHCVKDLTPGIILGSDFVYPHGVIVDGAKRLASIDKYFWKIWPMIASNDNSEGPWLVEHSDDDTAPTLDLLVTQSTVVPAQHHVWVPVRPNKSSTASVLSVIPAAYHEAVEDSLLLVQGSVISASLHHVLVTNIGTSDATIPSHTTLCQAQPHNSAAIPTGQVFTLQQDPTSPDEINSELVHLSNDAQLAFDQRDDVNDTAQREQLVADNTTLIDGTFNVGSASSEAILSVLRDHRSVFATDGKPGHVTGFPMAIPLIKNAKLQPEPPRRTSPEKRDVIDATIKQLLENDVIEPSSSPTSYPVLLVRQGPKWRMCVDYRGLNLLTVDDKYPLPRMDDVFEALSPGRVFSSVDAISGYFQLDVQPTDRYKTAFVSHRGLFQFKRIPFGLKNAPAHFQRFMDTLLGAMRWRQAMVYLDDVVIFSKDSEEHAAHLRSFLGRCKEFGLRLSPKKCFFAVTSLNLLGRLVTVDGVSIIPDRAAAIRQLKAPSNLQEVYHALGLFNYYRPFIPRFAHLAAPLVAKTKGTKYKPVDGKEGRHLLVVDGVEHRNAKNVPVTLDDNDLKAFQALKDALSRQVTLAHPDRDKAWILYIDASKDGYAAALHQQFVRPLRSTDVTESGELIAAVVVDLPSPLPDAPSIAAAQREDPLWKRVIDNLNEGNVKGYSLCKSVLVRVDNDTICLPKSLASTVFEDGHLGHPGFGRTLSKVSQLWHHPSLAEKVRAYVKHCPTCLRFKLKARTGRLDVDDDFLGLPFHTISLDLMLGLPGAKDACLIIVDVFSKMVLFHPLTAQATAQDIAYAFENMILRKGWKPSRIISDNDRRFTGEVAAGIAEKLGIRTTPSAPYHQAANPVERYVQTAKNALKTLVGDDSPASWPDKLPALELSLNSTPSTVTNYAPFDLVYCYRPSLVDALLEHLGTATVNDRSAFSAERIKQAAEAIKKAQQQQKRRYDRRRKPLPEMKPGDLVMVRLNDRPLLAGRQMRSKLDSDLEGPFRVKTILSDHRVELDLPPDMAVKQPFDVTQLQLLPRPEEDPYQRPGLTVEDADAFYEPQRILDERLTRGGHRQFYVKWHDSSRHTWEFEDDLLEYGCQDVIATWQEQQHSPSSPRQDEVFSATVTGHSKPNTCETSVRPAYATARAANAPHTIPSKRPQVRSINGIPHLIVEKPIAFTSRETRDGEKRLAAVELEASALAWAYLKLLPLFEGCHVQVVTDHSPLGPVIHGSGMKVLSNTLTRARHRLSPFAHLLTFHHRPGKLHQNVDALSRLKTTDPQVAVVPSISPSKTK